MVLLVLASVFFFSSSTSDRYEAISCNLDLNSETVTLVVQQISDAVTHARFVGTDSSSDEVVLMRILHVSLKISSFFLQSIIQIKKIQCRVDIGFAFDYDGTDRNISHKQQRMRNNAIVFSNLFRIKTWW